jgi:hypothetical protein
MELCRDAAEHDRDAAKAVARWTALERAHERGRSEREVRFRRRAFERARDRALIGLALSPAGPPASGERPPARPSPASGRAGWRGRGRRAPTGRRGDRQASKSSTAD